MHLDITAWKKYIFRRTVVPLFFFFSFFFLLERVITAGFNSYCTLFISLFSQQEEFAYLIDQYASCSFCTSARLLPTATVSHSSKWQLSQPHTHTHTLTLTLPLALQHGHSFTETQWSVLGFKQWFFITPDFYRYWSTMDGVCWGAVYDSKFVQQSRSHIWTYVKLVGLFNTDVLYQASLCAFHLCLCRNKTANTNSPYQSGVRDHESRVPKSPKFLLLASRSFSWTYNGIQKSDTISENVN